MKLYHFPSPSPPSPPKKKHIKIEKYATVYDDHVSFIIFSANTFSRVERMFARTITNGCSSACTLRWRKSIAVGFDASFSPIIPKRNKCVVETRESLFICSLNLFVSNDTREYFAFPSTGKIQSISRRM